MSPDKAEYVAYEDLILKAVRAKVRESKANGNLYMKIAISAGISVGNLSDIMNTRLIPSIPTIVRLALYLDIPVSELLTPGEHDKEQEKIIFANYKQKLQTKDCS